MNNTERYTIIFEQIKEDPELCENIRRIWGQSAEKEYQISGIIIGTTVQGFALTCGDYPLNCLGRGQYCAKAVLVRNPVLYPEPGVYFDAMKNVVLDVKEKLNAPYTSILAESIYFSYFEQRKQTQETDDKELKHK